MWQNLTKILWLLSLILVGGSAIYIYEQHYAADRKIALLEAQKKELETIVTRLTAEHRVAEMLVTSQSIQDGQTVSTVLFVEYDKANQPLPAKSFQIVGKMVHVDALVIKFDHDFVKKDDPLKGKSIALFTRIFGDHQPPDAAPTIDEPNKVPQVYQSADAKITEFEQTLWTDFWRLADDPAYRTEKGVRVAQGESPWGPLLPNRLYTLTLQNDAGLNLTWEPLKGIYKEALKPGAPR